MSPLQFDGPNTEAMLEFARAGMPYDVLSMAMGGAAAPMTLAGTLTIVNAEVLAGLTLCELVNPGCPVLYGSVATIMDMKVGTPALGAPERALLSSAAVQLAHHYRLPSLVGGISTDAKLPGEQAMFEKTMTGLAPVLAGSDIVFGPAVLNSARTYSVEQLVLDDEIAASLLRIQRGIGVDEDALALDLIDRIGPGGGFIGTRHTLEHVKKDVWMPDLLDRSSGGVGSRFRGGDMGTRAKEKVQQILDEHRADPLEGEQKQEIRRILSDAAALA